jgi:hypothetical protein
VKAGNLVKHRSSAGFGTVVDIDGLRHQLKIVLVMWADQRGTKYEPVNELKVMNESR